ncbi:hypothetical protein BKH41_04235 [Helicobacter sp. 12S02232-10]|uniref:hypothetical protein n=1 Tax=Helicobacter sp. 12S02232-10 TaxID=1476197 RepID=UPI000BA6C66F|nr:hypothetical protein [Helicobacter sp. 12S02232-10]PAF48843.1 hypothetical protein BKH41_04235 [Helicobacter sp. 12S02232-10]
MFMNTICRKANSFLRIIKGRKWGFLWTKIPFLKKSLSLTNFFPHPQNYRYILIGGHGLGMTALIYYLEKIGAKPMEIWSHEVIRPFIFYRNFDGLVLDKTPLNKNAKNILGTLRKKVPLYQIIRDPISVIKSNVNVTMFQCISQINSQEDATNKLFQVINNNPHIMFYFASTRKLIDHIITDVSYIRMCDIDDKNMPVTLKNIANRFNYKTNGGGGADNESVVKGSLFPRCFPHVFNIDGYDFILCTHSRLQTNSRKEMDTDTNLSEYQKIPKSYTIIKNNIIVKDFPQYPLVLIASSSKVPPENSIKKTDDCIKQYIDYALKQIAKHQTFIFTESKIIDSLSSNRDFSLKLAYKIYDELSFIRREKPEFLAEFIYTQKFLQQYNIDIFSNSTTKDNNESR